jgi:hypothetical protein
MYIQGSNQNQMTYHQDILRYLHLNKYILDICCININKGIFKYMYAMENTLQLQILKNNQRDPLKDQVV